MNARSILAAGLGAGALFGFATLSMAQPARRAPAPAGPAASAARPAAPSAQITNGPPIAGVCVFSPEGAASESLVGKAYSARMQQLVQQVRAELEPQETSFQTDGRALEGARGTLDQATFAKRAADLNLRRANLDKLEQQRQQELQATQQKAIGRINGEIAQALPAVYQQHNCSLLIRGEAVILANPAMDLTPALTTALNSRIQTITFDREQLPAQGAAATAQ
jgi:Skp family chaperone for outer membrane proteins